MMAKKIAVAATQNTMFKRPMRSGNQGRVKVTQNVAP